MKLSVKSDYAARAVLGLARHFHQGLPMRIEDLADEHAIPANYLVQILLELKSRSIVRSLRGKEGGYLLARHPREVTLGDVLRCVHGPVLDTPALSDPSCPPELKAAWTKLQTALQEVSESINFQQLLEQGEAKEDTYYI